MEKSSPRFSVIVPIYNVENFLHQCIDSILNQTYQNFELILVDDGSVDNCGRICDEYNSKSKKIFVIHKENGGLVSARKAGVFAAKGEYVAYVDGDDWVDSNWLLSVNKVIENYQPDMVEFNVYKNTDGRNSLIKTSNFRGYFDRKDIENKIVPIMLFDNENRFYTFGVLPAVWSKIIKREILKNNLCKDYRITFGEDVACTYNCILECNSFYGINDSLYYYRQNRQSMTKAYDEDRADKLKVLFDYLEKKLIPCNDIIRNQYSRYVLFCIFYLALNIAKSNKSIKDMAIDFENGLNKLKKIDIIEQCTFETCLPWNIMLNLIRQHKYKRLCLLCKVIVKFKYSFKS